MNCCSLDIEIRKTGSKATSKAVYSHLSSFLPINRETLMKRMKMLRQKEITNKLYQPIEDLKAGQCCCYINQLKTSRLVSIVVISTY